MRAGSCTRWQRKYEIVETNWGQKSYHLIHNPLETGEGCTISVQVQFSSWRLGTWSTITMNAEQKAEEAMTRPREIMITYMYIPIILVQD